MAALKAILGIALVLFVLWDAFETIILPRRPRSRFRLTRAFYRSTWRPWRLVTSVLKTRRQREAFLSLFGPLSLLFLLALWAAGLVLGFAVLQWAATSALDGTIRANFGADLYFSGSTLFTLGLGDVTPTSNMARFLAVIEAGTGLAFLAMMITYLPVLYQAFSRRETNISLLDARAGTPPTAVELLRRHQDSMLELRHLLEEWELWSAELLESHLSYPVLAYFRSQHDNQSWLAALTAVLDACTLCMIGIQNGPARQARLTFAMARHALVDLAQVFNTPPSAATTGRLPPAELARLRGFMQQYNLDLRDEGDSDHKLAKLRSMYEPYADALSRHLLLDLPPWIRPQGSADNWETSRWGRDAIV